MESHRSAPPLAHHEGAADLPEQVSPGNHSPTASVAADPVTQAEACVAAGQNADTTTGFVTPTQTSSTPSGHAPPRIRLLLADDHRILREGLACFLTEEPDLEIVALAADGLEAVELAHRTRPDVVLMDVTMPRLDGVGATYRISAELPGVAVIGLSMHEGEHMSEAMRAAGAVAYLTKGGASETLLATIRASAAPDRPV